MKIIFEKVIYYAIAFCILFLLLKFYGWIENAYLPFNTQTQLLSLIVIIPALVVLSFILSGILFKSFKESK